MKKTVSLLVGLSLLGCAEQSSDIDAATKSIKPESIESVGIAKAEQINSSQFTDEMAKSNLDFIKNQYVKMIHHVDSNQHIKLATPCVNEQVVCFPRAEEDGEIFLDQPQKWTNGFYPGLLWKLLSEKSDIASFTVDEQALVFEKAKHYQTALLPETQRGVTHDLGFILYDSYGEALNYSQLNDNDKQVYLEALDVGRQTLVTRFDKNKGVIKSWDWGPTLPAHFMVQGQVKVKQMELADPWTFPVIVDNMMNLEYLMSSDNAEYRDLAFNHAAKTLQHQYFYAPDDINKAYPIAYHLFDYDSMRPGNWQGVGNISAWARGQGWSLYGYVTVVEALQQQGTNMPLPDFESHLENLVGSIEHFLKDDPVPIWDYFAAGDDALTIAEDQSENTTHYSRILDLCDFEIPENILPYKGYRPVKINKNILSPRSVEELSTMTSAYNEPFIQGDAILPCGSKTYQRSSTHIPKDTSAAALYASALYRLAKFTQNQALRVKSIDLADRIMIELTDKYLTNKAKGHDFDLGFVLTQATGNLPNASEINTSIVYADFYFLEANIRKLALTK